MILGDFNAKVENIIVDRCRGQFGLGDRNERGERLLEFHQNEEIIVTNTTFKQPRDICILRKLHPTVTIIKPLEIRLIISYLEKIFVTL